MSTRTYTKRMFDVIKGNWKITQQKAQSIFRFKSAARCPRCTISLLGNAHTHPVIKPFTVSRPIVLLIIILSHVLFSYIIHTLNIYSVMSPIAEEYSGWKTTSFTYIIIIIITTISLASRTPCSGNGETNLIMLSNWLNDTRTHDMVRLNCQCAHHGYGT